MTTSQITNCANSQEARRLAIAFAQANNYNVTAKYAEVYNAWFSLMSEIHANGKEGNYEAAMLLNEVKQTLSTWN